MKQYYRNGIQLGKILSRSIINESKNKSIIYYNAIPHFEKILSLKDTVYIELPLINGALGITQADNYGVSITIDSNIESQHRKNFTIAHEIGHLLLHIKETKKNISYLETIDTLTMNVEMLTYIREAEANAFAANLLLPDDVSKFQIMSSMNAFQIKKVSGISIQALEWRIIDYLMEYHSMGKTRAIELTEEYCEVYSNSSVTQTELYSVIKEYPELSSFFGR